MTSQQVGVHTCPAAAADFGPMFLPLRKSRCFTDVRFGHVLFVFTSKAVMVTLLPPCTAAVHCRGYGVTAHIQQTCCTFFRKHLEF